ncbi:hypothetical protein N7533_002476 [Penicillium manginii]|uniref:uncharacterized protein n=1 Tax=Penicillium manginii TaxID=203109 RepID=UPI0025499929|nr:uncharacterized protein N7533_002476 [Penicillium manginii]KAJ5763795.1 hypothetical protein N7533_002476 [Penicillium manginii]
MQLSDARHDVIPMELSEEGSIVLETKFMGLIYEGFDLANYEVSLAEQAWNDDLDDIVEITKDGVLGAKKNVGNSRCVQEA